MNKSSARAVHATRSSSATSIVLRKLRKNKMALAGLAGILALVLVAILAPVLAPHDIQEQNLSERLRPPSLEYPFGTDLLGRCLLSRVIYGTRIALLAGVAIVSIQVCLGVMVGLIAAFYGRVIDVILMRFVDIILSFPPIVLALGIAAAFRPGLFTGLVALGLVGWTTYARLMRSGVLALREECYVEAARAIGASNSRIMLRHILPNAIGPILITATMGMGTALLAAAGLAFLGIGSQPPSPDWGLMLATGRPYLRKAPWLATIPGLAIMFTVLAFNFLGDGVRDALDPRQQ